MSERRPFKLTGTLDLECADWDIFVVGVVYDGHLPRVFRDLDELIDHLRGVGGIWFAHAGGIYDLLAILERCRIRGISCQVDRSAGRVTRIVIGKLTLRDSYAIWPVPLHEICGAIGVEVPHLPWKCICAERSCNCGCGGCGAYCRITSAMVGSSDPDLDFYCIADCRALYDGLTQLNEFATAASINLRGTLGQTAWVNAQAELGIPDSEITWKTWRHARQGDKGGRQAIIRPRAHGPGSHHDICNAYPAQLARAELPVGDVRELGGKHARAALHRARPGLYTLTVRVPDNLFLPPLPWSCGGNLTFPIGEFSGTWTLPELVAAFERGVSITEVHAALVYEATAPIFAPLVKRWYDIRRAAGRKTPLGQWIGRLAKTLTGKFAEKPDRSRTMMYPTEIKFCDRTGRCRNGCTKRCGAYEQVDLDGHIWAIPFSHLGTSAYPQWSAYLRAQTRVQWLEQAERYGEDLVMGNTDSIWTLGRKSPAPLGDDLGQWEYQHAWTELEIRSISTYAYRDEHGVFQIRGIPGLTEDDWKRGSGVLDRGVQTFASAAKSPHGLFHRRHRKWSLPTDDRSMYGDRRLGSGGVTYPIEAAELRDLAKAAKARAAARRAACDRGRGVQLTESAV